MKAKGILWQRASNAASPQVGFRDAANDGDGRTRHPHRLLAALEVIGSLFCLVIVLGALVVIGGQPTVAKGCGDGREVATSMTFQQQLAFAPCTYRQCRRGSVAVRWAES